MKPRTRLGKCLFSSLSICLLVCQAQLFNLVWNCWRAFLYENPMGLPGFGVSQAGLSQPLLPWHL